MRKSHARWIIPALVVVVGVAYLFAGIAGGKLQLGLEMFGVMLAAGLGLVIFGSRSETVRGLSGAERDERFTLIDLRATALTATVLLVVIVGAFIYELAQGHSGAPYFWLAAVAGITYLVSVAILRFRS